MASTVDDRPVVGQVEVATVRHDTTTSQTMGVKEAAQVLGVSQSHLYELVRTHRDIAPGVPFLKIGSSIRIPRERCLAFARGELPGGAA